MSDQLIDDYLHELKTSAWIRQMPRPRAKALEDETRARIRAELDAAGRHDEETVYSVLDRMGPASDIVARDGAAPPSGTQRAAQTVLSPLARLQFTLAARGWALPEIGGLLLLIASPVLLWWIGPVLGIILVRTSANRWSERAEHVATVVVFGLLAVHFAIAIGLLAIAFTVPGPLAGELQHIMALVAPGALGLVRGFDTVSYGSGPMVVLAVFIGLLPLIAGAVAGIYLWMSPRIRR